MGVRVFDGYILCGTPRSGSTLLCGLLEAAGAGAPDSFFRRQIIDAWAAEWGLARKSLPTAEFETRYVAAAIAAGKGGTPVFGLRLMHENLEEVTALLDRLHPGLPCDRARLDRAFVRLLYDHQSRADKLAQAISRVKAEQTGLWHVAPDGREIERLAPPGEPRYDFARLRREVDALDAHDTGWRAWFEAQGITPLAVDYDALSADPAATLARICAALGVETPPAGAVRPGVARLADASSADWARRYRAEAGAG